MIRMSRARCSYSGSTLLALGRAAEAAVALRCEEAVAIRPGHREQRQALARALLTLGRPRWMRWGVLWSRWPGKRRAAEVQYLCGTALNAFGRRPIEAAGALRDATLAAAPEHADAHLNLGNALADLGDLAGR